VLKSLTFYNTAGSHSYMIVMRWNEDKHFHNTIPFRQLHTSGVDFCRAHNVHIAWENVIIVWNCVLTYKRIILHRLSGSGRGQLQTEHCEFPHSRHELKKYVDKFTISVRIKMCLI
jgi:hypothetical protein